MKKSDYIVIQAAMISDLGLKGNSLILFALIHGFTKDGKQRFRGSLRYMAEWLSTSKGAVSAALRSLEESGYITRHECYDGGIETPEYTTNYDELLLKVEEEGVLRPRLIFKQKNNKGTDSVPISEVSPVRGTDSVPVLNQERKGYCFENARGTDSVPNNIIDNIYNNSFSFYSELPRDKQQEEEKEFFKIFFFKGSIDPQGEVRRFVAHNTSRGWKSAKADYDTPAKRIALADLWDLQLGKREAKPEFFDVWRKIYNSVAHLPGSDILLDHNIFMSKDATQVTIICTREVSQYMEQHLDCFIGIMREYAAGRKVSYKFKKVEDYAN